MLPATDKPPNPRKSKPKETDLLSNRSNFSVLFLRYFLILKKKVQLLSHITLTTWIFFTLFKTYCTVFYLCYPPVNRHFSHTKFHCDRMNTSVFRWQYFS